MENNAASNHKRVTIHFQPEPWLLDYIESLENGLGKMLGYKGKSRTELLHELLKEPYNCDREGVMEIKEKRTLFKCPNGEINIKTERDCRDCQKWVECPCEPWNLHKKRELPESMMLSQILS